MQVADLPSKAMHSEQPLTSGIKSRASWKVYASLSRRTTAVEVDGALAAAEDDEDALGPEDSLLLPSHEEQFLVGRWLSRR